MYSQGFCGANHPPVAEPVQSRIEFFMGAFRKNATNRVLGRKKLDIFLEKGETILRLIP